MNPDGTLYDGGEGKSQLMNCIAKIPSTCTTLSNCINKGRHIVIIDAMVIVQKLEPLPIRVNNCCDLANLFLDKIRNLVKNGDDEIHILFDQYTKNYLKKNTQGINVVVLP